jgi:hypothetical protein
MNAEWIITVFVVLDELLTTGSHQDHQLSQVGDAEILTVAVVAAKLNRVSCNGYLVVKRPTRNQGKIKSEPLVLSTAKFIAR